MKVTIINGFLWPSHDSKYFVHFSSLNSHNNPVRFGIAVFIIVVIIIIAIYRWGYWGFGR